MSQRTELTRKAERGSHDRALAEEILGQSLIGHVGFADATGAPMVLPVAIAPDGDRVLFHGSTGSRLFRTLAAGAPVCLTVTLLDALVYARSAFESSMNYRSLVVVGTAETVTGPEKERALAVLTEHLTPGRWDALRPMTTREVAATLVLALPLVEFSVKSRHGGTDEPAADHDWPTWAGQIPVQLTAGTPLPEATMPEFTPQHGPVPEPLLPQAVR